MDVPFDSLVRLAELVAIIGGGSIVVFKLGRAVTRFEMIGELQAKEIKELKEGVQEISVIVTQTALQNQRQDIFAERLLRMEEHIDELRHGEGFIMPIGAHLKQTGPP